MDAKKRFDKKIFTAKTLIKDSAFLFFKIPEIIKASKNNKIGRAFMEKIMTVTTAVNGCVYCAWFHAKQAIESGITEEEVKNMLNLQFHADATEFETMGLLYAQHYAETDRNPDNEMTQKLFDYYGETTAVHIILYVRMIFFGNLYGNTWDAVLSRLKGNPAKNSNLVFELFFFFLNFWIMFPAMLLMKTNIKTPD